MRTISNLPWEALVWLTGLIFLALYDPGHDTHFTICPLALAGFEHCPGCGLGRSISYLLKGEVLQSLTSHPLGIFAAFILTYRILQLTRQYLLHYGKSN